MLLRVKSILSTLMILLLIAFFTNFTQTSLIEAQEEPPNPRVYDFYAPINALPGNTISIRVCGVNEGGRADEGDLHIILPDLPDEFANSNYFWIRSSSGLSGSKILWPGDTTGGANYGGPGVVVDYPIAVGWRAPWGRGETACLEVGVKIPDGYVKNSFRIFYKMTIGNYGKKWYGDPKEDGSESNVKDQQNEYVWTHTISITTTGNLQVNVHNIIGYNMPGAGTLYVKLYDQNYIKVREVSKPFSGGESYVPVAFSEVSAGSYIIEVYQTPMSGLKLLEFWGADIGIRIEAGKTTTFDFYRHTQVLWGVRFEGLTDENLAFGQSVTPKVTVKNFESYIDKRVKVRLIIDRDKVPPYDYDQIVGPVLITKNGGTYEFTLPAFKPTEPGTYYHYPVALGEYGDTDNYIVTDQGIWWKAFDVSPPLLGGLAVQCLDVNGNPVPNVEVKLYKSEPWTYLRSQRADSNGRTTFTDLSPDLYYVTYVPPTPWQIKDIGTMEIGTGKQSVRVEAGKTISWTVKEAGLEVYVEDQTGKPVQGAEILLYIMQENRYQHLLQGSKKITDNEGKVVYRYLAPNSYYWNEYFVEVYKDGKLVGSRHKELDVGWNSVTVTVTTVVANYKLTSVHIWVNYQGEKYKAILVINESKFNQSIPNLLEEPEAYYRWKFSSMNFLVLDSNGNVVSDKDVYSIIANSAYALLSFESAETLKDRARLFRELITLSEMLDFLAFMNRVLSYTLGVTARIYLTGGTGAVNEAIESATRTAVSNLADKLLIAVSRAGTRPISTYAMRLDLEEAARDLERAAEILEPIEKKIYEAGDITGIEISSAEIQEYLSCLKVGHSRGIGAMHGLSKAYQKGVLGILEEMAKSVAAGADPTPATLALAIEDAMKRIPELLEVIRTMSSIQSDYNLRENIFEDETSKLQLLFLQNMPQEGAKAEPKYQILIGSHSTEGIENVGTIAFEHHELTLPNQISTKGGSFSIVAKPPEGYEFLRWESGGAVKVADSKALMTTLTVEGDGWLVAMLTPINHPPYVPQYPSPSYDAMGCPIELTLSWVGGDPDGDKVTYEVYLGTTPMLPFYGLTIETSIPVINLKPDTTYYWRVVAKDDKGARTEGPLWRFTTAVAPPPPKPDLIIEKIDVVVYGRPEGSNPREGDDVEFRVKVKNVGLVSAQPGWHVDFYIDGKLEKRSEPAMVSIISDATLMGEFAWKAPEGSAGKHTLKVVVDPTNVVDEGNEANNEKSIEFIIEPRAPLPLPDLTIIPPTPFPLIEPLIIPPESVPPITIVEKSIGDADADMHTDRVTVSITTIEGAILQQLEEERRHSLKAGESSPLPLPRIPILPLGKYKVKITITLDVFNEVKESNEDNNVWEDEVVIEVPPQPTELSVDVWTNKGGQGRGNINGGQYSIGESITLYCSVNTNVDALRIKVIRPDGVELIALERGPSPAGIYQASGTAGEPVGERRVICEARSGGQTSSDEVRFTVTAPSGVEVRASNVRLSVSETRSSRIILSEAPEGLAGYKIIVRLVSQPGAQQDIADIVDVRFPEWADLKEKSISDDEVRLRAVDVRDMVRAGAREIILAEVVIKAKAEGTMRIELNIVGIDDDEGKSISATTRDGVLEVVQVSGPPPVEENLPPPRDLDSDGLYEDINGNGRLDFDDVVKFFEHFDDLVISQYSRYYDFNRNGRLDYDDIIELFERL
jgi:PKD repeat protein